MLCKSFKLITVGTIHHETIKYEKEDFDIKQDNRTSHRWGTMNAIRLTYGSPRSHERHTSHMRVSRMRVRRMPYIPHADKTNEVQSPG